jgi:hypothetical protein
MAPLAEEYCLKRTNFSLAELEQSHQSKTARWAAVNFADRVTSGQARRRVVFFMLRD